METASRRITENVITKNLWKMASFTWISRLFSLLLMANVYKQKVLGKHGDKSRSAELKSYVCRMNALQAVGFHDSYQKNKEKSCNKICWFFFFTSFYCFLKLKSTININISIKKYIIKISHFAWSSWNNRFCPNGALLWVILKIHSSENAN